jgi:WXXGXW repeat (2 copies)
MKVFRSARWFLMALLLSLVPASSYAGVFISVGFAPPVLPVYEQPPCPQPGWMWTPGYWAYGDDGYYWVPGAWVPAPYEGALWTPGYWGWSGGLYVWHGGYWGPHVGYYGGVNYGFGYMGVGFAGGLWRGHDFVYNTAVVRVNTTIIHNTYIDRTVVERTTVVNDRHVAFSGGPGGIRHEPLPEERIAEHDRHTEHTSFQAQHVEAARADHNAYFRNNGGRPQNVAVARPMGYDNHGAPGQPHYNQPDNHDNQNHSQPAQFQPHDNHQPPAGRPNNYEARPAPQQPHDNHQQPAQIQPHDNHQPPASHPNNYEARPAPQQPQHQQQSRPEPQHQQQSHPEPQHESKDHGDHGHGR